MSSIQVPYLIKILIVFSNDNYEKYCFAAWDTKDFQLKQWKDEMYIKTVEFKMPLSRTRQIKAKKQLS